MLCIAAYCFLSAFAIDGDTFWARTAGWRNSYRVWGIDTPERGQPGYTEAKVALQELIEHGAACDQAGSDTWGRKVVACTLADGRDVGCEMIRAGHAAEYVTFSRGAYADCANSRTSRD